MFTATVPGHSYSLETLGKHPLGLPPRQQLDFIQMKDSFGKMMLFQNGVTTEEVLAVLIDRVSYLENLVPCQENADAISFLEAALKVLESRTKDRKERGVEGTSEE